jgi:hypothetical protein
MSTNKRAEFQRGIRSIQQALEAVKADINQRTAKQHAIELAMAERLGHPPEDGETITAADVKRAEEILALYPASGAE